MTAYYRLFRSRCWRTGLALCLRKRPTRCGCTSRRVSCADLVWLFCSLTDHPFHAEAVELHKLYRQKVPAKEVYAHLATLPNTSSGPGEPIPKAVALLATETLLHLGSRSFSHFLNATERYIDLLRDLTPDRQSRQIILEGIHEYWQRSGQMRLTTIDKYIQYGVLEGLDVVDWIFAEDDSKPGEEADGWTDGFKWEVLRMTLDKAVGRVNSSKARFKLVEREDEAARARKAAEKLDRGEGVGEDEDVETSGTCERAAASRARRNLTERNNVADYQRLDLNAAEKLARRRHHSTSKLATSSPSYSPRSAPSPRTFCLGSMSKSKRMRLSRRAKKARNRRARACERC